MIIMITIITSVSSVASVGIILIHTLSHINMYIHVHKEMENWEGGGIHNE